MDLEPQKNFYDQKRYFQGKDNPGDPHPDPTAREPLPRGQIVFGVLFIAFVALLALLRVRSANQELKPATPLTAAPVAATR
jgi:hypothetical protein